MILNLLNLLRHAPSRIFCSKIAIFSQLRVYSNITQKAEQTINLLLVSNFYPVISYRRVEKRKRRKLLYTVWSLVMVRGTSCQRNGPNKQAINFARDRQILFSLQS